jgi:hypothetical protein
MAWLWGKFPSGEFKMAGSAGKSITFFKYLSFPTLPIPVFKKQTRILASVGRRPTAPTVSCALDEEISRFCSVFLARGGGAR